MSIDKFVNFKENTTKSAAISPPREGFKLTTDGNNDISKKQFVNVGNSSNDMNAANLSY